jgi:putative DNA primase/helicase
LGGVILGEPTPALQMTGSEDEIDKRVLSLLVEGETLIHLDNLGEFLDSKVIASLLTATTYKGRWLGSNRMITAPNNLTIIASGNNVRATGEIVKRTIPVCLQPSDGKPEDRTNFVHPDLRGFIAQNRRRILSVLLGMIERWKAARRPPGKKPMGGFETWSRVLGGIMDINGFFKWRGNADEWMKSADPHGSEMESFVEAWYEAHAIAFCSTQDLAKIARDHNHFMSCFAGRSGNGDLVSFARKVLSPSVDRPVGDWIIRRASGANGMQYRLEVPGSATINIGPSG